MKDMRSGATLPFSDTDPACRAKRSVSHFFTLPYPLRAVLIQTARPHQTIDFFRAGQRLSRLIATDQDPATLMPRIAALVGETLQAKGCSIVTAPLHTSANLWCWLDFPGTQVQQFEWSTLDLSAFDPTVWQPGEPLQLPTVAHAASAADHSVVEIWQTVLSQSTHASVRSILTLPIEIQGKIQGIISLLGSSSRPWTELEIEGLKVMADHVAIASQIYSHHRLERQAQYQVVVNQLTLALQGSSSLSEILQLATQGTATALQIKRSMLLRLKYWDPLFKNRGSSQLPQARVTVACEWLGQESSGVVTPPALNQSFWMAECLLSQKAFMQASAAPTLDPALENAETLPPPQTEAEVAAPVFGLDRWPALLIHPLESQGTVLGFLVLQHDRARDWQPEEVELVKLVSAQVSTAIVQTETLKQVQSLVEKRTAELRESLAVQSKMYERTRQQIDQLRHLNQLKDEFLDAIGHELRTPLTKMKMAISNLRQIGVQNERGDRYLRILEETCDQETNLILDLLALQELESKQATIQVEEIDLKALIKQLAADFEAQWAAKGLTLELKLPRTAVRLQSDRACLNRILLELLTNAGKYSDPNTSVSIQLTYSAATGNEIGLTCCNFGAGISAEDLPYIFDKFRRTPTANLNVVQGTGLGLALVKSLVQHLSGSITAASRSIDPTPLHENCFTLTLPQVFNSSGA
jgi:signal transduction histidine kinase